MRIFLKKPKPGRVIEMIDHYAQDSVTHPDIGSTRLWTPEMFQRSPQVRAEGDFLIQMRRANLGEGHTQFECGQDALRRAACFDLQWVDVVIKRELQVGDTFCVMANAFGFWAANFCQVAYLEKTTGGDEELFSLGICTLEKHAAVGEERIAVSWNRQTNQVDFLIGSISRPSYWLARLLKRYLRHQQQRFAVDSCKRLFRELNQHCDESSNR